MKGSWLIQRLKAPYKKQENSLPIDYHVFAFGGGYKNGGCSDKLFAMLTEICSFDYMGAAEFEFGALPEAFQMMVKYKEFIWFEFPLFDRMCAVFCNKDDAVEIKSRILLWSKGKGQFKERTKLDELDPENTWNQRRKDCKQKGEYVGEEVVGWIELDNGFIFTVDPNMKEGFRNLFGLEKVLSETV